MRDRVHSVPGGHLNRVHSQSDSFTPSHEPRKTAYAGGLHILDNHVATAACKVPSIKSKRVTPHVLRHSSAMTVLDATRGDIRKVSIWLGHADVKITEVYLRSSAAEKLEILEANTPPSILRGTFNGVKDSLMMVLGGNWP